MKTRVIYIIGSLRNPKVPVIANAIRKAMPAVEVFDSWYAPGPHADDYLRDYAKNKGLNYKQTLQDHAAKHIFAFDLHHLKRATDVVLVMPAGKSGHLELGWALGQGKRGYVLFDKAPKRVDIMYQFATEIFFNLQELLQALRCVDASKQQGDVAKFFKEAVKP
jgi:hypothetical protein